jgi:hypothetical protein
LAGSIGLDPAAYGTHSMRRTKPTLIYRRTKNLRAFSYCSAIRNLRAPSDTSGSMSMTRWRSRSKLRCSPARWIATVGSAVATRLQPFGSLGATAAVDPKPTAE